MNSVKYVNTKHKNGKPQLTTKDNKQKHYTTMTIQNSTSKKNTQARKNPKTESLNRKTLPHKESIFNCSGSA